MLKLGELVAYLKADDTDLERGLDRGERRFDRFGRHVDDVVEHAAAVAGAAGERGGELFAQGLFRDHNGRLHDSLGRFVSEAGVAGQQAGGQLAQGLNAAGRSLGSIGGPLMTTIAVLLGLSYALMFVTPVIYTFAGALGAIPALAGGAGFAIATLVIGFMGLGDAFKKTAAAGGGVADKAYQVATAQWHLAQATRDAAEAAEAVTRAREDEIERLEDLTRAQARASNDQKRSIRAVEDAEKALRKARAGGNASKIAEAQDALEAAELDLDDVKDRVEDLGKERAKADKAGVEGSDQVQAALRRQEQATYAVRDAAHALQQAQKSGGGGGAGAQATKLAASAAATVALIKGYKDEWESLRLATQERLFTGVPGEIRALAKAWFGPLRSELGLYADTYNAIFKTGSRSVRQPEFIASTLIGLESVRGLLDRVGQAAAGPGVRAWGQLTEAAKPFVDMLGTKLAGTITRFSDWIDRLERSGQLDSFFATAAQYLDQIWTIGGDVFELLGNILSIFFDSNLRQDGDDALGSLQQGLEGLNAWLDDPANRQSVIDFANGFFALVDAGVVLFGWLQDDAIPTVSGWIDTVEGWIDTVEGWVDAVEGWGGEVVDTVDEVASALGGLPGRVQQSVAGLFSPIRNEFRDVINWIISAWNRLQFMIGDFDIAGVGRRLGSSKGGVAGLQPAMAAGGTALQAGMAYIAEHGTEGISLPLPKGAQVQPLAPGWRNQGQAGGGISGWIEIRGTGLLSGLRETVAIRGGRVEAVVGA